ncbi:MAG: large subunit ribosomal protein L35 [Candidatus Tokpelaia sp. JSC085]|nr:MAG: large subunit ribosomal protein L35 [Candidatus Tokpelaia sp. JSC085]
MATIVRKGSHAIIIIMSLGRYGADFEYIWRRRMPGMKTKSSAKKRFKITANGKVKVGAAGKRHGMIKRSRKFIRNARGTMVLSGPDTRKIFNFYLPNQ